MKGLVVLVEARSICGLPPIISLIKVLKSLDYRVVYLGMEYSNTDHDLLESLQVEYSLHPWNRITRKQPLRRLLKQIEMMFPVFSKRRWLWRQIRACMRADTTGNVFVWSFEMLAAAYLGNRALRFGRRHIQTFYELGDENCGPVGDFDIKKLYAAATLVECENNRASILKAEQSLSRMPFVIPNKIFEHPRQRHLPIADPELKRVVEGWGDKPVFLYQGWIGPDRKDLLQLLDWLAEGLPDVVIAIMARKSDATEKLAEKYANISLVPFVAPPGHLTITSWATVGLAAYTGGAVFGLHPLNAVHCAPNKIYEYSGFGIPILSNAIPGLRDTVGRSESGICVADWNKEHVMAAARSLLENYDAYSGNSCAFFESIDLQKLVSDVLSYAQTAQKVTES